MGSQIAWAFASVLVALLSSSLTHQQMLEWGWRIPFLQLDLALAAVFLTFCRETKLRRSMSLNVIRSVILIVLVLWDLMIKSPPHPAPSPLRTEQVGVLAIIMGTQGVGHEVAFDTVLHGSSGSRRSSSGATATIATATPPPAPLPLPLPPPPPLPPLPPPRPLPLQYHYY